MLVLDDDVVVVAALFVGRRYTIVVTWPSVEVYVNVEYESRLQYSRNGIKVKDSLRHRWDRSPAP